MFGELYEDCVAWRAWLFQMVANMYIIFAEIEGAQI